MSIYCFGFTNIITSTLKYNGNKLLEINYPDEKILFTYTGDLITKIVSYRRATILFTTEYQYENNYIYYWYYIYYINSIFNNSLTDKNFNYNYEKYNILVLNFKYKQLRLTVLSFKNKVLNFTVGRVLSSLKILDKSKKKTNKGERLFLEYINNFFFKTNKFYGKNMISILKIKNFKPKSSLNNNLISNINKIFLISKVIYDFKVPNNFLKFKKLRSIKKRIKKKIIKLNNIIN